MQAKVSGALRIPEFEVPLTASPVTRSKEVRQTEINRLTKLLRAQNAVLIAHYYTDPEVQELAESSCGFIGDSLAMAQFGVQTQAETLVVAGVRFMGETAKILSPEKTVLMPTLQATCSLDLGCPIEKFSMFCAEHPDRVVVVYANTSAAVKAQADWVVTSSNALEIVSHLDREGKKILWGPDRHLGAYIQHQTGADMVLWAGSCIVHEEYKAESLQALKKEYPQAAILVHPESPKAVIEQADVVGSTTALLKASKDLPQRVFIVATDRGIFYKMQQASPTKIFIEAPTAGHGATCRSCGHCPWMAMNTLARLEGSLLARDNEIFVDLKLAQRARISLQRMLDFRVR